MVQEINEEIIRRAKKDEPGPDNHQGGSSGLSDDVRDIPATGASEAQGNRGKLLLDATCTPADIRYPTDLRLINEGRKKTEQIIDILFAPLTGKMKKPRTYWNRTRKEFLMISKQRRKGDKRLRSVLRRQLGYVKRNLAYIEQLAGLVGLELLTKKQYRDLLAISELYRQQQLMFDSQKHAVPGRIVSISQPHVRPIPRGKAHANVEFGAKLTISVVGGYVYQEKVSWEAYHEGKDLIEQVRHYKKRFGWSPEVVLADKIYQNRENRAFCKAHGIRLSGPALGRPSKDRTVYREQKETTTAG